MGIGEKRNEGVVGEMERKEEEGGEGEGVGGRKKEREGGEKEAGREGVKD